MQRFLLPLAVMIASAAIATAQDRPWLTDWEAAKTRSKAENKPILLNLVGSDWCGWCIKLEKEVLSKKQFLDFAAEHLVLMEADFPRKTRFPKETREQNEKLRKTYLEGGYPTMFLLDSEGNKLSEDLSELPGGVEGYLKKLKELLKIPAP